MKKIPISNSELFALVDDEDFPWLSEIQWHLKEGYAAATIGIGAGRRCTARMHRAIMMPATGLTVDHINGDRLDNRKENLRSVTKADNNLNLGMRSDNTSGYKGVHYFKRHQRWTAAIRVRGRRYALGYFDTAEAASQAYEAAAALHFGSMARKMTR